MEEFDIKKSPRMVLDEKTEREILRNNAGRYKPLRRYYTVLFALLVLMMLLLIFMASLSDLSVTGKAISFLPSNIMEILLFTSIGLLFVIVIVFYLWVRRAHENLHAIYAGPVKEPEEAHWDDIHLGGSAIRLEIFRMIKELVQKSSGPGVQEKPSPSFFRLWMILAIVALLCFIIFYSSLMAARPAPESPDTIFILRMAGLFAVMATETVLTIFLLEKITKLQEATHAMINL